MPLPGVVEHQAWTGVSWRAGSTTFAHIVQITDGWPPSYALAFAASGPTTVVTFQAGAEDYLALAEHGPPFHTPPWRPGIIGLALDVDTDWSELAELITESHRICQQHRRTGS